MGCFHPRVAVATEVAPTHVVGENKEHIGWRGRLGSQRGGHHGGGEELAAGWHGRLATIICWPREGRAYPHLRTEP